ncbi:MAG: UDP-3-O-acyl-N-acetylglucosamine deacetylase [Fimbriimonadaceae bacterium]|nr:UDP-3-O-acyl-N-acetylglucosamine deacetylase [Fimbriimonadaceae bacterium]
MRFAGPALHAGAPCVMTMRPANDGVWFFCGKDRFEAVPENVTDTQRCTRLGTISTIEHVMSALAGLEVTDAHVELTYPEVPALDGSARSLAEELVVAELEDLPPREVPSLFDRVFATKKAARIGIAVGNGRWRYDFSSDVHWPFEQRYETDDVIGDYRTEIAPARTWTFASDIEPLRAAGLGRGLDETTVVVLGEHGYLNDVRFDNEPARHKLLDAIGDLYLSGVPIRGLSVVATGSGHTLHVEAAHRLRERVRATTQ